MIRVYCKFCLEMVDTVEEKLYKNDRLVQLYIVCINCKKTIGYTI